MNPAIIANTAPSDSTSWKWGTVMVAGWYSNSNYSLLGGLRSVAQTISYEVSLALILLSFVFLVCGYNLVDLYYFQVYS
jgi:NADH-ubiquinone oxidoreductase chain 1